MAGDNFDALRKALADGPTPGPWEVVESADVGYDIFKDGTRIAGDLGVETPEDASYIAAANPATLTALLAERDALQAKVEAMKKDAGRLDWLETTALVVHAFDATPVAIRRWSVVTDTLSDGDATGDTLRAAIDAARAALAQPTGEKP